MSKQPVEIDIDTLVRAEKLQLLFTHSFPAIFVSALMSILLTAALWNAQSHKVLITWLSLLGISSVIRLILFIQFRRKLPTSEEISAWEKPYFITLMLSSVIWGIGSLYLIPEDSPYHQLIILFFLMGIVGGAIASYWAHRLLTLITVAVVISPVTIWISLQSTDTAPMISVGICALTLYICLIRSSKVLSGALTDNLLKNHDLQREKQRVEYLARKDALTNLYNRRAFYEQLNEIGAYCERHNEAIAVIVMDVDDFKEINDKYGHVAGDEALIKVGKAFKSRTRTSDICARIGGEEFGILIRSSNMDEALQLAEKLREEIASTAITFEDESFNITASFGVACSKTHFGNMVNSADMAMYQAKAEGKNKVVQAE